MNEEQFDRIKSLLTRNLFSDLNEQETEELNNWRSSSKENEELFNRLTNKKYLNYRYKEFNEVILNQQNIHSRRQFFLFRNRWTRRIAAALIIGAASFSLYQIVSDIRERSESSDRLSMNADNRSSVTLTVDGTTTIDLGNIQGNTAIGALGATLDNHALKYNLVDESDSDQKTSKHEIYVPEIEMFKVILPDGTEVWLNSKSRLSYPSRFEETSREVVLEGEGLFKVSKDASRPFYVMANGMRVRVTGTLFNVKAYKDDNHVAATLVEGKISVGYKDPSGDEVEYKMCPGQQSKLDRKNREIEVREVNTSIYTSWKDGVYFFDAQRLEDIMKDLGRWYGFDVVFVDDAIKNRILSGKLYREDTAGKMLESFATLMPGHIRTEGRTVTIY